MAVRGDALRELVSRRVDDVARADLVADARRRHNLARALVDVDHLDRRKDPCPARLGGPKIPRGQLAWIGNHVFEPGKRSLTADPVTLAEIARGKEGDFKACAAPCLVLACQTGSVEQIAG